MTSKTAKITKIIDGSTIEGLLGRVSASCLRRPAKMSGAACGTCLGSANSGLDYNAIKQCLLAAPDKDVQEIKRYLRADELLFYLPTPGGLSTTGHRR